MFEESRETARGLCSLHRDDTLPENHGMSFQALVAADIPENFIPFPS